MSQECTKSAGILYKELRALEKSPGEGRGKAVAKFIARKRKAGEIQKLKERLKENQKTLDTKILIDVRQLMIATFARQDYHHSNFDQELSNLGAKLASCHISAADNLKMTIDEVVEANKREHGSSRRHFDITVQALTTGHANQQEATKRHEQLLDSLRYDEINLRQNEISEPQSRTFGWVFEDETCDRWDSLSAWLKHGQKLYWINGKAGSGKSTFMKFLVSDHRTLHALVDGSGGKECIILAHYLWLSGSKFQRSMRGLLCSLLYQITSSNATVAKEILRAHEGLTRKRSPGDWSLDGLKGMLEFALNLINSTSNICIFLDGIDEFDQDEDVQQLLDFIEVLMRLPCIKFCVSSRPEANIERYLSQYDKLRLQDLTREDMRIHVKDTLDRETARYLPYSIKAENVEEFEMLIVEKADGVFLWVNFALRNLLNGMRNEENFEMLKEKLEKIPRGMTRLYHHMWHRLNENKNRYRQEASLFFSYNEFFPLSLFEMTIAFNSHLQAKYLQELRPQNSESLISQCESMKIRILTRCAGLLEVTTATKDRKYVEYHSTLKSNADTLRIYHDQKISFMHRTARDFLLDTQPGHTIAGETSQTRDDRFANHMRARMASLIEGLISLNPYEISDTIERVGRFKTRYETDLIETFRQVCQALNVPGSSDHDINRTNVWALYQSPPPSDVVGTAAFYGCMKYVTFYVDRASVSVSPYYRGYLFMCAMSNVFDEGPLVSEKTQLAGWLAQNGADLRTKHCFDGNSISPPLVTLLRSAIEGFFPGAPDGDLVGLIERLLLTAVKSRDRFLVEVNLDLGSPGSETDLGCPRSETVEGNFLWVEIEGACLCRLMLHRLAEHGIFLNSLMSVATTSGIPMRVLLIDIDLQGPDISLQGAAFLPAREDSIYLGEACEEYLFAAEHDHGSIPITQNFCSRIEETLPRCTPVDRLQWERQMGLRADYFPDVLNLDPSEDVDETNWRERGWFRRASSTKDGQPASTNWD